jgi:hypothetical protein
MQNSRWAGLAAAALLAGSVGCATTTDVTELRSEMAETRQIAEDAQRQAAAAAADAAAARQSAAASEIKAQEASDKADRIFQKTLRK